MLVSPIITSPMLSPNLKKKVLAIKLSTLTSLRIPVKFYMKKTFSKFKIIDGVYQIDIEWYLTQQIMPPVQRLLEVIPGIIISEIAMCLGLDGSKYKNNRKK